MRSPSREASMTSSGLQATNAPGPTTRSSVPILVVDDNSAKRLALKAVLLPLGYSIVEADSGEVALRCVMDQDFAVILLDVRMPVMDGFETAALIRQRRQSEMTPIIFITAYANDEIVQTDRYVEGAVDFMFAPVQPDELRAKVSVFAKLFIKAEILATRARGLQSTADQLRLLTEAAPIGIFQTDSKNRYLYTNPRWTEITGIPAEEAAGRGWDIIIDSEQRAALIAESADGAGYPVGLSHRFEIRPPGSGLRMVLMTSRSIPDAGGGIAGWVGTLADVTAEAGAEAAMSDARDKATEASRLKSDFLANMSHEIRTPMNGVIGMSELLLDTDLTAEQREYAQMACSSGEVLLTVVNDILDLSKIEAGKLELEEADFDVVGAAEGCCALLRPRAEQKGLELRFEVQGEIPQSLRGDENRLRQILLNLVVNAIKFTERGAVTVAVRAERAPSEGAGQILRFKVSDPGVGIDPSQVARLFAPFAQADSSTTRRHGGTGLGLSISKQLVGMMQGEIGAESEAGVGSTFWFTIPLRTAGATGPDRAALDPGDSGPPDEEGDGRPVILVAEDNTINQVLAVKQLEKRGYRADVVADGRAAVEALLAGAYSAVLMDCQMPVMDGYEATAEIRRQEGAARRIPIVAVTAHSMTGDRDRCLAAGMDDYLSKPIRPHELDAVIERYCGAEEAP